MTRGLAQLKNNPGSWKGGEGENHLFTTLVSVTDHH